MKKNILVTGGAGFVGSHLTDALLQQGHHVRIFDNLSPQVHSDGVPSYLAPEAELMIADVRNPEALRRAVEGMDVIYHLASAVGVGQSMYEISNYMEVNTQGTANLLQVLLDGGCKIEKLVVASSMSIYGEGKYHCAACGDVAPEPRPLQQLAAKQWEMTCPQCASVLTPVATDEAKPLQCTSIYALSKKDQEEMCLLFGRTYSVPVVALRFFNIYGSRQALSNPYTGVAAIFASRLLNGRSPLIFEDGRQMRDFVSVHDVVQACVLAMESSKADGKALNVGSGVPISIQEVAAALSGALDRHAYVSITGKYRAGDIRHCFGDISAARQLLNYHPKVKFAKGMADLAHWLRSQQPQDHSEAAVAQLVQYGLTA
ncbi:MAG TPA: NAD-dependent epimerase/dehydratase family protein [Terriglobales bacterium]|nr:NAD-dependent epimerase/dehydratase family protein [Terriglobales bacterium]